MASRKVWSLVGMPRLCKRNLSLEVEDATGWDAQHPVRPPSRRTSLQVQLRLLLHAQSGTNPCSKGVTFICPHP